MIRHENECVECGKPCLGRSCPYLRVRHLYCDRCMRDVDTLYVIDEEELCKDCAAEVLLEDWEHVIR